MADPDLPLEVPDTRDRWTVYRQDDNGNRFMMKDNLSKEDADQMVAMFEARGHKQLYWAEQQH